jgi:threonine dehydrogenase-like Zn-dependent dehydrogenase
MGLDAPPSTLAGVVKGVGPIFDEINHFNHAMKEGLRELRQRSFHPPCPPPSTPLSRCQVQKLKSKKFQIPAPKIGVGPLLRIDITGVCGSDWGYFQNLPKTRGPVIFGHEIVGSRASPWARWPPEEFGVKEGDLVASEEYRPCGHCRRSLSAGDGDFRLCGTPPDWRLGGDRYGATGLERGARVPRGVKYSQYMELDINTVFHRVPDGLDPKFAALVLPMSNGIEWTDLQGELDLGSAW